MEIIIKPHHFMDIIKLYGSGIEHFVPDEKMHHDFYKVANNIINDPSVSLKLTIYGDDICKPCIKYKDECTDLLDHILGYTTKNNYNQTLDKRIIELYNLRNTQYTALELCTIIFENKDYIYDVWKEEDNSITDKRYKLFSLGAMKFLNK